MNKEVVTIDMLSQDLNEIIHALRKQIAKFDKDLETDNCKSIQKQE